MGITGLRGVPHYQAFLQRSSSYATETLRAQRFLHILLTYPSALCVPCDEN